MYFTAFYLLLQGLKGATQLYEAWQFKRYLQTQMSSSFSCQLETLLRLYHINLQIIYMDPEIVMCAVLREVRWSKHETSSWTYRLWEEGFSGQLA